MARRRPRLRLECNSRRRRRGTAAFWCHLFEDGRSGGEPIGGVKGYRLTSTAAIQRAANSEAHARC